MKRLDTKDWGKIELHRGLVCKRYEASGVTLSFALRSKPTAFDGSKLNLVGQDLSSIDGLPPSIAVKLKTLYLSNNNLMSLNGVDQFRFLSSISCANNLLRYLGELRALSVLEYLEKVVLDGNIVTTMPFYREYILELCPSIKSIDGIRVSPEERANSKIVARKAQAFYEQMRLNELRNCILDRTSRLLSCHVELLRVVLGTYRCGDLLSPSIM